MCLASTSRTSMFSEQWLHMRRKNYFGAAVLAVRFASKRVDWAFVNLMPPAHTIEHQKAKQTVLNVALETMMNHYVRSSHHNVLS